MFEVKIPSPKDMAEDTAQELYRAGYNLQFADYGFAFDNALEKYNISDFVELSEIWYELFEKYFQDLKNKELKNEGFWGYLNEKFSD